MMTRRFLLAAAATTAAAAAIPVPAAAALEAATKPRKVAWLVGSPGEWNFELVRASTAEKAIKGWVASNCDSFADEGETCDCTACTWEVVSYRVAEWDGLPNPTPADWLRVGLGHVCDRCGYECDPEMGARPVGDDAVCQSCLTPADLAAIGEAEDAA